MNDFNGNGMSKEQAEMFPSLDGHLNFISLFDEEDIVICDINQFSNLHIDKFSKLVKEWKDTTEFFYDRDGNQKRHPPTNYLGPLSKPTHPLGNKDLTNFFKDNIFSKYLNLQTNSVGDIRSIQFVYERSGTYNPE